MVLDRLRRHASGRDPKKIPDGLWVKCPGCSKAVFKRLVEERLDTCPECNFHFPMPALRRMQVLLDPDSWQEWDAQLASMDPLKFNDTKPYPERVAQAVAKTGLKDTVVSGTGQIDGQPLGIGVTDFAFMAGSMGSVMGEKIARMVERSTTARMPVVIVSASGGGARMQEGAISLMQMAKTSAALARHHQAELPFISILTNPTMGGVMASYASLGDVIIAEPKALIGFTGPRVIKETIKQELPEGFQTSEFLLKHGQIDLIVTRQDLRTELSRLISYLMHGAKR